MPIRKLQLPAVLLYFVLVSFETIGGDLVTKTNDCILIHNIPEFTGDAQTAKLQNVSKNIIRVTAGPQQKPSPKKSLILLARSTFSTCWKVSSDNDSAVVDTENIRAAAGLKSGSLKFSDKNGASIFSEKELMLLDYYSVTHQLELSL